MRRSWIAVAPAALLLLVSAWEIAATVRAGGDVGDDRDWAAAAGAVRARHRPGDLIVFAPRWVDPIGRMHLGDLIPVQMAARMDAARYARIWEVSVRGARPPQSAGATQVWRGEFGPVTVRQLAQTPIEVVADFVELFPQAAVSGAYAVRSRDRMVPPAVDLEEVGFEPHWCVRVVPRANQTIRISYGQVPLGSLIVGYVGLADVFTRRDHRQPAQLAVEVNGRLASRVRFGVDDGWVRFEIETEPTGAATVTFAATAIGAAAHNKLVCFAAEARK